MPTRAQLYARWASERYFGNNSQEDGYNVRGSAMAGSGLHKSPTEFTGEVIGTLSMDPDTQDLVFTPLPPTEESAE